MKCPLLCLGKLAVGEITHDTLDDCLKEECAWWDSTALKCAVLQLTFELDEIHCHLDRLLEKMPHEGQFRR